ncbi:MAG: glycosyl transferase [Chitinophagaceae bacterium]|nr:glycosyl transferase [Chitinophagaceae bacterium]
MKILYAIQGTGNGHVCRALEIVPLLSRKAEVDVLISGIQSDINLPFDVKYVFKGLSFIFGKKGGVDLLETYKKSRIKNLLTEIRELPVDDYDLVISDFEPVSSWACHVRNKTCISLSHQAAVINRNSPQPKRKDAVGKAILKMYAPFTVQYGFHFQEYDENIFTPVIRKEVREAEVSDEGHYTVYLPAYSDKRLVKVLGKCEGIRWEIFSKHFEHDVDCENIKISPLSSSAFIKSMASSRGVICGAGFETPAEALFLGKKLLVIPMKNQYEQHCNAAALKELGVAVLKSLKRKHLSKLEKWLGSDERIHIDYPDNTEEILDNILSKFDPQYEDR